MSYRIKRVAHLTGINPTTLRAWERRYGLVAPDRTPKGYRLYSDADVQMLRGIKELVDSGLAIGEAVEVVRRAPRTASEIDFPAVRAELREALLALDRPGALRVAAHVAGLPPEALVDRVYLPLLEDVGDSWEHGQATVAQEHFASGFIRDRLGSLLEGLSTENGAREAVVAGLPGDRHELGLMAAAVHLEAAGWRAVYLGSDVPLDDLADVLRTRRPDLLCVSVVRRMTPEEFEAAARALVEMCVDATEVCIGGSGIPAGVAPKGVRLCQDFSEMLPDD